MEISLLQWNVLYEEKAANILELIRSTDADIVCLQELTQDSAINPNRDIPAEIAALGYRSHYETAIEKSGFVMGNGIFSKYPIVKQSVLPTQLSDGSGDYDKETRLYLEAQLDINGNSLFVGTAHLSYTKDFEETPLRTLENEKFLSFVGKHKKNFIFCGDFNSIPDSQLITELSKNFTAACPPFSEPTWTTKPFSYNGFNANTLDWRLDYVFTSSDVKVLNSRIIQTEYSDHLPIHTEIEIQTQ